MFLSRDLFFSYWFVSAAPATLTMQALCNSKRWIRPGVKLGPTTIDADPGGEELTVADRTKHFAEGIEASD